MVAYAHPVVCSSGTVKFEYVLAVLVTVDVHDPRPPGRGAADHAEGASRLRSFDWMCWKGFCSDNRSFSSDHDVGAAVGKSKVVEPASHRLNLRSHRHGAAPSTRADPL